MEGFRSTEDGQDRITEDGGVRITEDFSSGRVSFAGVGGLSLTAHLGRFAAVNFAGDSGFSVSSFVTRYGRVQFQGAGALTALARRAVFGRVSFAGASAFSLRGVQTLIGRVTFGANDIERATEDGAIRITEDGTSRVIRVLDTSGFVLRATLGAFQGSTSINVNGVWVTPEVHARYSGAWVVPRAGYAKNNGEWRRVL